MLSEEQAVEVFKQAWHAADSAGEVGGRVRAGLAAVRAADAVAEAQGGPLQFLATFPDEWPYLPGGQVLMRSWDHWQTAEACLRPNTYATWTLGRAAEQA